MLCFAFTPINPKHVIATATFLRHLCVMATQWLTDRITIDPERCSGRPTIRGTRMRVLDILEMLADGMSQAEILEEFDKLEAEDIRAAINFAAASMDHKYLTPI
jgi:uncharacterized protein (DUF433 family)